MRVGIALYLVLQLLLPEAHLDRHAFIILFWTLTLSQIQDIEEQDIEDGIDMPLQPPWRKDLVRNLGSFLLSYEIVQSIYDLGQYIYRA